MYHHDVPKKMRRLAIRSALSDKVANDNLIILNDLTFETPRTRAMLDMLGKLPASAGKRVLVLLPQRDENVIYSTRNIPTAKVQHVSSINVVELLKHDCLIMPLSTVRWIEMVFGEGLSADEASERVAESVGVAATPAVSESPEPAETVTSTESDSEA